MPSEQPNENMDKALKAYAQKRRDESDQFELDLATRNMLQAEVQRTLGKVPVAAQTQTARPRFAWWPRIIMGVACTAALALAFILWKAPTHEQAPTPELTTATTTPETPTVARTATDEGFAKQQPATAQPAPAPSVAAAPEPEHKTPARSEVAADRSEKDANKAVDAPAALAKKEVAAPLATPRADDTVIVPNERFYASEPSDLAASNTLSNGVVTTDSIASSAGTLTINPSTSAALAGNGGAIGGEYKTAPTVTMNSSAPISGALTLNEKANVVTRQRIQFAQVNNRAQYRANLNSPPLPKVLTNFNFELNGTNVLVRDADGSVYSGKVTSQAQNVSAFFNTQNANAAQDNYAFRVSGYNNRLRAKVIFTGNVTNALTNQLNFTRQLNVQNQAAGAAVQQNMLLNGRVQVGKNTEFEIEAAPTTK
jgi:hypothetical protein